MLPQTPPPEIEIKFLGIIVRTQTTKAALYAGFLILTISASLIAVSLLGKPVVSTLMKIGE